MRWRKILLVALAILLMFIIDALRVRADASLRISAGRQELDWIVFNGSVVACDTQEQYDRYLRRFFGTSEKHAAIRLTNYEAGYETCEEINSSDYRVEEVLRYWGDVYIIVRTRSRYAPSLERVFIVFDTRPRRFRRGAR